jgi:hypothetical protein
MLWPPNQAQVPVTVSVSLTDPLSAPRSYSLVSITSNETLSLGDVSGFTPGLPSLTGLLRATRFGTGNGRVYSLKYTASDRAGNTASCTTTATVPHNR